LLQYSDTNRANANLVVNGGVLIKATSAYL
jgi:hypothetical protein